MFVEMVGIQDCYYEKKLGCVGLKIVMYEGVWPQRWPAAQINLRGIAIEIAQVGCLGAIEQPLIARKRFAGCPDDLQQVAERNCLDEGLVRI